MATHLSESSVNSLLRLINQADTSASHNEKVDLLKKSRILAGDKEYSSVVNKSRTVQVPYTAVGPWNVVAHRLGSLVDIVLEAWASAADLYVSPGDFARETAMLLTIGDANFSPNGLAWFKTARNNLSTRFPDQALSYAQAWKVVRTGIAPLLFGKAKAIEKDPATRPEIKDQIRDAFAMIDKLGIDTQKIANYTSDKLTAFFVDGTYKFTYILFPTTLLPNGATGTGTSVISSNYDSSTKLLDKKAMINTFLTQPPQPSQIALQSFDITSTFMVMETYGSSLLGTFKIDGNKLQIKDYGFDATTGTFTNFQSVYQKTEIGYVVSNYNTDTDQLHSVWYYSIVPVPINEVPINEVPQQTK
jgi:hypothetical protein